MLLAAAVAATLASGGQLFGQSIWMTRAQVRVLPVDSAAWMQLKAGADSEPPDPNLADQDEKTGVYVLAKALVFARSGNPTYRQQVVEACQHVIGTEQGGRTLSLGRKLASYVIAVDLIGWHDDKFDAWLRDVRHESLDGRTLVDTHEDRPNNWGTHCGASRIAVAAYLADKQDLDRAARVFHGWLGNHKAYDDFTFGGDLSWQADEDRPVGVNPLGATKDGHSIDGCLPDDMRRGGDFQFPPGKTRYPWGALEGAVLAAELLERQGYPAFAWEDKAILRAFRFLYGIGWQPDHNDQWMLYILNRRYGPSFKVTKLIDPGKNMAWTNWTHAPR